MSTQFIYNLTDTWNNAGTVFTAIKMNVTDVASNASSALLDLQVGGVSQFKVSKAGAVTAVGVAVPTISSSDTLSNKTLASPVLSGTVTGSPTFSGALVMTGTPRLVNFNIGADSDIYVYESATNTLTVRAGGSGTETFLTIGPSNVLQLGGVAIPTISSSDTLSNKTLSSPTLSGTVAGSPTFSGGVTFSRGTNHEVVVFNQTNPATYNLDVQWQDNGAVRWLQSVRTNSNDDFWFYNAARASADISISAASGVVAMANGATGQSGAAIPTISSSDTLSNKTLSSPTLSGTISGNNITFTGPAIKIGDGTDTVAMTGTSPLLRVQGASFSTGITVRRDGNAEVGIQAAGTGNIGTWTAHNVQFMRNGSAIGGFDANAIFVGQVNNPRFYLYNNAGTASTLTLGADSADTFLGSFTNAPFAIYTDSAKRVSVPAAGGMVVGTAAIATNATDGFLYVPTCAGTPTGTPTTQTGTAPIVIDTTNNKLYFYSGGAWRDAGP